MSYVVQDHSHPDPEKPGYMVVGWTIWSEVRQARKKLRAKIGATSGRQWKKAYKAAKRAQRATQERS